MTSQARNCALKRVTFHGNRSFERTDFSYDMEEDADTSRLLHRNTAFLNAYSVQESSLLTERPDPHTQSDHLKLRNWPCCIVSFNRHHHASTVPSAREGGLMPQQATLANPCSQGLIYLRELLGLKCTPFRSFL
ncbi:hypothetical protein AAHC03_027200 [Spirometra sp. Aus1]